MESTGRRLQAYEVIRQRLLLIAPDYTIIDANQSMCHAMNRTREQVIGRTCYAMTHQTERPCWEEGHSCPVWGVMNDRKRTTVIHHHSSEGTAVIEEIVASPVLDENGEIAFIVEEIQDVTELVRSQQLREHLENELAAVEGLIPICAACKRVRNDEGYWEQVEKYLRERTEARFSHSVCPDCFTRLYPEQAEKSTGR